MLHNAGYRYRLHVQELPGKPDLVFVRRRKIILVHGCFWHMHEGCRRGRIPGSRIEFWTAKLHANRDRDERNLVELKRMGWQVLTVWECQLDDAKLFARLREFLE
jgi:DNA mismatch endonuclease (patch repair protein)